MRVLLVFLVMIALVLMVGGVYLSFQTPPPPPVVQAVPERQIVIAQTDISTGSLIVMQNLGFGPVPAAIPGDQLYDRPHGRDEAEQRDLDRKALDQIAGSVARHRFAAGEALQRGAVVKPGDSGFLAAVLSPGTRAITIGVTAVSGAGGLIYPGDRVDVILTQTFGNNQDPLRRSASETIAGNVRVIAIDQQLQGKASPEGSSKLAQTATLEVDPRTAEKIALAGKLGDLALVIRSLQSPDTAEAVTAVWADDVSQALRTEVDEQRRRDELNRVKAPGPNGTPAPAVIVYHGDKIETVNGR